MVMTPGLRKFALATHVTSSVGWVGAVAAFLALAIAGIGSQDAQIVRAAYLAMHLITWFVIVPLSFAALSTGIAQSLGTSWGLFEHYWVVTKLLLTVLATIILLTRSQSTMSQRWPPRQHWPLAISGNCVSSSWVTPVLLCLCCS